MKQRIDYWKISLRSVITLLAAFGSYSVFQDFLRIADSIPVWKGKLELATGVILIGLTVFYVIAWVVGMVNLWNLKWKNPINTCIARTRDYIKWFRWPIIVIGAFVPGIMILYTPMGFRLTSFIFRLALFLGITCSIAVLATRKENEPLNWSSLLISILMVGSIISFAKAFISVVDHPLSLTWSEGNRIWDYSVLFGRDLYIYPDDQPIKAYIDRGRQTLWGLPFLLPKVSIVGVRLWSAILFTIPYALLGWMVFSPVRRLRHQWVLLGLWSFLFLNQGPIYTPLVLSAILIVGTRRKPIWISLLLIFLAGYYAQVSRFTWMFAPAFWVVLSKLLDPEEIHHGRISLKKWVGIFAFGIAGLVGGLGLSRGWIRVSGFFSALSRNNVDNTLTDVPISVMPSNTDDAIELLSSANRNNVITDQSLLWDRLLPNPTYGLGIILGLLLAVTPILLLLIFLIQTKRWRLNRWQLSGLFGILGALMVVGLVISTKIGGGGDLHNMDMFLISILFASGCAWEYGGNELLSKIDIQPLYPKILLLLVVFIPAFIPWIDAKPLELPPIEKTQKTLDMLIKETKRVISEGGEVLFMDQRQLLTFGYLGDVPLVPEYEKKLVMDRAMSGNIEYFEQFYKDISEQRFGLIVTDPQRIRFSDEDEGWGEENDTWVQWVAIPLLCYYDPVRKIRETGVWFLEPLEEPGDCSYP